MSNDTDRLPSSQRAALRSRANGLKATIQVGKEGVTDAVARTLEQAFTTADLLKVKILETAPQSAKEAGPMLAERIDDAYVVQTMGRIVTLYRELPEKPRPTADEVRAEQHSAKPKPRRTPTRGKASDAKKRNGPSRSAGSSRMGGSSRSSNSRGGSSKGRG